MTFKTRSLAILGRLLSPLYPFYKEWDKKRTAKALADTWAGLLKTAQDKYPVIEDHKDPRRDLHLAARALIDNQYRTAQMEASYKPENTGVAQTTFRAAVEFIHHLPTFQRIVGVQPMAGPVGKALALRINKESTSLALHGGTVEACTSRLRARWTLGMQDDIGMHLPKAAMEAEIASLVGHAVAEEILINIVSELRYLAGKSGATETSALSPDQALLTINMLANDIARKTRRGAGNFVIASATAVDILRQSSFRSVWVDKIDRLTGLMIHQVGVMNGSIDVYQSPDLADDEIIVGYKGKSGAIDTGYVYCPYVPVLSSGVVMDQATFEPMISLMTRAGTHTFEAGEDFLASSTDYYRLIKLVDLPSDIVEDTSVVSDNNA